MSDEISSSVDDYLEQIRLTEKAWESDYSSPVGRITDVFFANPADEEIDTLQNKVRELRNDDDFNGKFAPWVVKEMMDDFKEDIRITKQSDGNPIVFIVELPNGQTFGDIFERPRTTNDRFFAICDKLGVDVEIIDELDSDVFIGNIVPVTSKGVRWRIDTHSL